MARWAGEGKEWIELMTQTRPQKEDVIRNLLESMKQPVDKKKESKGPVPTKKPRDLPPPDLGTLVPGEQLTLESKGDNKTIVDWVNGHAKMKTRIGTVEKVHNFLCEWCGRGIRLRQQTDWVTHSFHEHNKEAEARVRRSEQKNGWTPLALRGTRFLVSVDSGMEALTKVNVGVALSSWPSRYYTDGSPSTKSVVLYQGTAPWKLKWVVVGCLLTIYNNGWKSAHAESVQLLDQSTNEILVCVLLLALHFSVACVARGWTVTEPTTPVSF